mgnify:CR=1 FL=1
MDSFLKKCVLYGAGVNAHGVLKYVGKERICAVIDSAEDRIGKDIEGIPIISLDTFMSDYEKVPIIISAYQKSTEIIKVLQEHSCDNFLESVYLQASVTEIDTLVNKILQEARGRKLVFDDTQNVLIPLIIDELKCRNKENQILGVKKTSNIYVAEYYNIKAVDVSEGNCYTIITETNYVDKKICEIDHINICNLMYYNPEYQNVKLEKYKNIYLGKRCFVIGNGPSLRMDDLTKLKQNNEICFGSNGIYHAYDKTDWRPDYYVIVDFIRYKESYETIKTFPGETMFVRRFYNMEGMEYNRESNVFNSPPQKSYYEFSGDITKAIYSGATVTYNMLQIAAYMGFSEIYLLGVDFSFDTLQSKGTNHFDTRYETTSKMKDIFHHDENLAAYIAAEKYSRDHGFRIYNATRGGKLEVFERVNFDSLL